MQTRPGDPAIYPIRGRADSTLDPTANFGRVSIPLSYDAINRLTRESVDSSVLGNDYTKEFFLVLVGKRTKWIETMEGQSPVATTYNYNARDQLLNESDGTATIPYGYDSNGSLTSQSSASSSRTQTWDLRGRLSGATVDGVTMGYRYTPEGIHSSVTENGSTIEYLIDCMTHRWSSNPLQSRRYRSLKEEPMNEIEKASIIELATQFALNNDSYARAQGFEYKYFYYTDLYYCVNFRYLDYNISPGSFTVVIPVAGGGPYFEVMI